MNRNKKILHIIAQRPGRTGSGIYLQSIINEADKADRYDQAAVFAVPKKEYDNREFDLDGIKNDNLFPVIFETEDLPFSVVGMSDVMPYLNTKYSDLTKDMFINWKKTFSKTIDKAIEEFNPDVIISHHIWLLSSIVKEQYPSIPMIVVSHGTGIRQLDLCKNNENGFNEFILNQANEFDLILALNDFQKELIISKYKLKNDKKIKVLGNGYNSAIFSNSKNNKKNLETYKNRISIIYVGKLSYSKGVLSLLNSIKNLLESEKEDNAFFVELKLVGSGETEESEKIKEFASRLNRNYNKRLKIIFTGAITQIELNKEFNRSDIFILPSFYEGLPLVIIEALATGLKIISSDLPGLKEWLGKEILELESTIKLVKLPKMRTIDIPEKEELKSFEVELSNIIYNMIDIVILEKEKNVVNNKIVDNFLLNKSWKGLFGKIEEEIKIILEVPKWNSTRKIL